MPYFLDYVKRLHRQPLPGEARKGRGRLQDRRHLLRANDLGRVRRRDNGGLEVLQRRRDKPGTASCPRAAHGYPLGREAAATGTLKLENVPTTSPTIRLLTVLDITTRCCRREFTEFGQDRPGPSGGYRSSSSRPAEGSVPVTTVYDLNHRPVRRGPRACRAPTPPTTRTRTPPTPRAWQEVFTGVDRRHGASSSPGSGPPPPRSPRASA